MIFTSFDRLKEIFGVERPSLAPEGYTYWSKLEPHILAKEGRDGRFTTIRIKKEYSYTIGRVIPIYLDYAKDNYKLFDAEVIGVKNIRKADISEKLAKGDADMTVEELHALLDVFYKKKYGDNPQLEKITMRKVL